MYGARPLKRVIQRSLQDKLAGLAVGRGRCADGAVLHVSASVRTGWRSGAEPRSSGPEPPGRPDVGVMLGRPAPPDRLAAPGPSRDLVAGQRDLRPAIGRMQRQPGRHQLPLGCPGRPSASAPCSRRAGVADSGPCGWSPGSTCRPTRISS